MAWLERDRPEGPFQIVFRFGQKRIKRSARTRNEQEAVDLATRIERRLRLIEQGDLTVPEDADVVTFLMSDGKLTAPVKLPSLMTLSEVFADFFESLPPGAIEENSRRTAEIHRNHLAKGLGANLAIRDISHHRLQAYINQRAVQQGRHGGLISPITIKKELATLSSVWSFALMRGYVSVPFPRQGLRFPKSAEKPRFQTRAEIEHQIACVGLASQDVSVLWESLYLTLQDVEELLKIVREQARHPFLYPMVLMAADTGARRSELLRSEKRDFDLNGNFVTLQERKRSRERHTTRRVPLSDRLRTAVEEWLTLHPGGPLTFCLTAAQPHQPPRGLSVNQAHDHFGRSIAESSWSVIRGWHVLRHSFASNCASRGIDQRIINAWMGHQTEEMVRRYQHLVPHVQQAAMQSLLG